MSLFGKRKAVLAVNVPGMAPYSVIEANFKQPRGKIDLGGAGLPALVSSTDPTDVEILWDEVPSLESQISQRMDAAMQTAGPAADMMAQNAKRALAYVQDPAMREMLIKQYRSAGIEVDEGDEAT